jgi:uncharacterized protein (DUF2141 family)
MFRMKFLLLSGFLVLPVLAEENNHQGNLVLDIGNVLSGEGTLRIALYQYVAGADWNAEPFRVAEISPVANSELMHYTFESLPFNDYAIRLFHDINGNKKLDLSESGFPVEPFAISRAPEKKERSLLLKDAMIPVNLAEQRLMLDLITIKQ